MPSSVGQMSGATTSGQPPRCAIALAASLEYAESCNSVCRLQRVSIHSQCADPRELGMVGTGEYSCPANAISACSYCQSFLSALTPKLEKSENLTILPHHTLVQIALAPSRRALLHMEKDRQVLQNLVGIGQGVPSNSWPRGQVAQRSHPSCSFTHSRSNSFGSNSMPIHSIMLSWSGCSGSRIASKKLA